MMIITCGKRDPLTSVLKTRLCFFSPIIKSFTSPSSPPWDMPICDFPDESPPPWSLHLPLVSCRSWSSAAPGPVARSSTIPVSGLDDTESGDSTWAKTCPPIASEVTLFCPLEFVPVVSSWFELDNLWKWETPWRGIRIGARWPLLWLWLLLAALAS